MTPSKIVLYLCLSFIGGIFVSSFLNVPNLIIGELFILGGFYILFFIKQKSILVFGFCLIILACGILRYQIALNNFENAELKNFIDFSEPIQISAKVIKEPDVRENNINLTVSVEELLINKIGIPMEGKVLVTTERYPEYQYGDELKIIGLLKTPPVFEDFNYKDYLRKDGILAVMSYPEISQKSPEVGPLPSFYGRILSFKNKLREVINQNLSPPQRSILAAVILGDKRNISEEWKDKLNKTGVRHITAVSGMHIIILTSILMTFLIALGFWRGQAFYLTIGIIFLYILMIGFQPSAVRAAIMAGLFLSAQKIGRISYSQRAIVFAGALMLTQNPFLLKDDVGFQLSFFGHNGDYLSSANFSEIIKIYSPREIFKFKKYFRYDSFGPGFHFAHFNLQLWLFFFSFAFEQHFNCASFILCYGNWFYFQPDRNILAIFRMAFFFPLLVFTDLYYKDN